MMQSDRNSSETDTFNETTTYEPDDYASAVITRNQVQRMVTILRRRV